MSHLDHPVKAARVTILNFTDSRQTEIHAEGCAHEGKASRVHIPIIKPDPNDGYGDDWYHVAPCARRA